MYSKYSYNIGATKANILADVVAILTGTTDKALLSAVCDETNTEILTTYDPAGWTVHDATPVQADTVVLKSPCEGDAAQFKYVSVQVTDTPAERIKLQLWDTWDEVTAHTGTNPAGNTTDGYSQRWSSTTIGTLYICANSGLLYILSQLSGVLGSATSNFAAMVAEGSRGFNWCDVGEGFMPACIFPATGTTSGTPMHGFRIEFSRCKLVTGGIQSSAKSYLRGGPAVLVPTTDAPSSYPLSSYQQNQNGSRSSIMTPIWAWPGVLENGPALDSFTPSKILTFGVSGGTGTWFDTVSLNGIVYVALGVSIASGTPFVMIRQG